MAALLFAILLAILAVAATAAGFVNAEWAVLWWTLAGVFAVATIVAFAWERLRGKTKPPPERPEVPVPRRSTGISISDSENVSAFGNYTEGMDIGIDAKNVKNFRAEDNVNVRRDPSHRMVRQHQGLPQLDDVRCTCGWEGKYQEWRTHRLTGG
jgi:hypothetical protein